jgi:hypothetical protein
MVAPDDGDAEGTAAAAARDFRIRLATSIFRNTTRAIAVVNTLDSRFRPDV